MKKIVIKYLLTPIPKKLNTIEGVKKLNKNGEFKVEEDTALQMVDNVTFGTTEELDDITEEVENEEVETEDDDLEDEELNDDDKNPSENPEVDDETKLLLESLPGMKRKELDKVAEDIGLDPDDFKKKNDLMKKMVAILKGKIEA